ncbi:MAG TPA: HlyD family efflux transporter periplasmic adaptor subunit [Cryomorphaceae bacterium]|nr:HlyD family efflux transporter periplasmic adaptor subunit [Cryomorphaceae bacterium]
MDKRKIIITLAGVGVAAASVFLAMNLEKEEEQRKEEGVSATAVRAEVFTPDTIRRYIDVTGRLVAMNEIQLYAEVGGQAFFGNKPFKEGTRFSRGEVIIRVNSDEIESSLTAARSGFQSLLASVIPDLKLDFEDSAEKWENYLYDIDINTRLPALPETDDRKLKLFLSGRNVYSNYYNIKQTETRFDKHLITAPFNGSVTEANIDEGELVRVGQPLGEFLSTGQYEVMLGVSYEDLQYVKPGKEFKLEDVNTGAMYRAKVSRINDKVDPETQQVQIYAEIRDDRAKSGVFVKGKVPAGTYTDAIRIPTDALVNENAVFVVGDSTANLMEIQTPYVGAETAIIKGIQEKTRIVIDQHNESLDGSVVTVVNLEEE